MENGKIMKTWKICENWVDFLCYRQRSFVNDESKNGQRMTFTTFNITPKQAFYLIYIGLLLARQKFCVVFFFRKIVSRLKKMC